MQTEILYEDDQVIVAYKPAGLATQTAKIGQADMVSELKNYTKNSYLGVVHRLDQPVEGVLVFGRTKAAASNLSGQLSQGILNKQYYAVVCGMPAEKEGRLENFLYKTADGRAEIHEHENPAKAHGNPAKRAVLQYRILGSRRLEEYGLSGATEVAGGEPEGAAGGEPKGAAGGEPKGADVLSLADIHIETGRFHQIRAQLAHAGMPIIGDVKYGDECSRNLGVALFVRNVALCAYELRFTHPMTHRPMNFWIKPKGEIFQKLLEDLPK